MTIKLKSIFSFSHTATESSGDIFRSSGANDGIRTRDLLIANYLAHAANSTTSKDLLANCSHIARKAPSRGSATAPP
jgi:hypothetical protein